MFYEYPFQVPVLQMHQRIKVFKDSLSDLEVLNQTIEVKNQEIKSSNTRITMEQYRTIAINLFELKANNG